MAGWGWLTADGRSNSGYEVATSNQAELGAVEDLLEEIDRNTPLLVKTDSTYVVGQLGLGHKTKKNPELVARIKRELVGRDVEFEWVPREQNVEADRLAREAAARGAELAAMRAITTAEITVGVIFEDCGFHPVLCTLASPEEDELQGISLIDGQIRSCSMFHCGPELLSLGQVLAIKKDFPAYVAARTAGGGLPVGDDLPSVEASDVMGMAVPVRPYAPETGVRLVWVPGARIDVRAEGTEVHLKANAAGLLSLASHLLALYQDPVPDGSHIHLDEFSGLEDGSAAVVIERG